MHISEPSIRSERKAKMAEEEIRSEQRDLQQGTPRDPKSESRPSKPKKPAPETGL